MAENEFRVTKEPRRFTEFKERYLRGSVPGATPLFCHLTTLDFEPTALCGKLLFPGCTDYDPAEDGARSPVVCPKCVRQADEMRREGI